jgi:hypothetical protein
MRGNPENPWELLLIPAALVRQVLVPNRVGMEAGRASSPIDMCQM